MIEQHSAGRRRPHGSGPPEQTALRPRSRRPWPRVVPKATALLALSLLLLLPASAAAKSFIWKVERNGRTSYLLGSIHLADRSFYPLPAAMREAFAAAKVLVLEARPDRLKALGPALMAKEIYRPPDSLAKHVSKKTIARLRRATRSLRPLLARGRLSFERLSMFKPWLLAMVLSNLELQRAGYKAELGIDMHFFARRGKRRVDVLEGAEAQLGMLSKLGDSKQERFLLYTLHDLARTRSLMKRIVTLYKRGDHRRLSRLLLSSAHRFPGIHRMMFTERNRAMAETIDAMLEKSSETHLIIVGAGHVGGRTGLLRLLSRKGFELHQL